MADLSTIYPQMAQAEGPQAGLWQAQQAWDAQQNNQINQASNLQQLYENQQMLPLKMGEKQSTIGLNNANAAHANALASNSFYDLDAKERLKEPTYQAALSGLAAQTTENEVKQAHSQIEKDLMSPDPATREQAQQRYKVTGDMLKMYEANRIKSEAEQKVANIHAGATLGAARIAADASTANTKADIKAGKFANHSPWYMEAQLMKTPQGAISVWEQRKNEAADRFAKATTPEERQDAQAAYQLAAASEATARQQAAIAATAAAGVNAGKSPSLDALGAGKGIQAVPAPQAPTPVPRGVGNAPQGQHTLQQLQAMYPGKSPEELKQAYKAKFGVDPQ
jgi:hypothetical protein